MAARVCRLIGRNLVLTTTAGRGIFRHHQLHHRPPATRPPTFVLSRVSDFAEPFPDLPFSNFRSLSTALRRANRRKTIDVGARARQLQTRRLWTYALTFGFVAAFIVIVLSNFQEYLVFYVTPTEAIEKFKENPEKKKFRLGGLVLEGSVAHPASSPEMEFVVTDLITDILVRYEGSLPDLFREGHSVVVEGWMKPLIKDARSQKLENDVSEKARNMNCFFSAIEVLAKHDEKYMPSEVAAAIEKNRKLIQDGAKAANGGKL